MTKFWNPLNRHRADNGKIFIERRGGDLPYHRSSKTDGGREFDPEHSRNWTHVARGEEKNTMYQLGRTGCVLTLVCTAIVSVGCGKNTLTEDSTAHQEPSPLPAEPVPQAATFVYECDDNSTFMARIEGETAWAFLPTGTVSLPQIPSGSGAKYSDGDIMFWSTGEEATLEVGEGARRNCRNNRAKAIWEDAKLRGVDFRAVGNEPGWNLEISAGGGIVYVGDYGQTEYRFRTPDPVEDRDARRTTYTVNDADHQIVIVLDGRRCQDTMSGDSFETTVTVVLDGREFTGCGQALH